MFSLKDITALYELGQKAKIQSHRVDHAQLGRWCAHLDLFRSTLGDNRAEDFWIRLLTPLHRYRVALTTAPLPFNYPDLCRQETVEEVRTLVSNAPHVYPQYAREAQDLLVGFEALRVLRDNPLLEALLKIRREFVPAQVLLLENGRWVNSVESILATFPETAGLVVLTPSVLRGAHLYTEIFAAGIPGRFPAGVFSAPRAQCVHIFHYSWVGGAPQQQSPFVASLIPGRGSSSREGNRHARGELAYDSHPVFAHLYEIARKLGGGDALTLGHDGQPQVDALEARMLLVEGGRVVFVDAEPQSVLTIIDLEDPLYPDVHREAVAAIDPGTFVLLRTEGGGDYIVQVADHILGSQAEKLRGMQREWKVLLREWVRRFGTAEVVSALRKYGCSKASEQNVRNWFSLRTIRTRDREDFEAIMHMVDLKSRTVEYWDAMGDIARAHREAGFQIRMLLLEQVRQADLSDLQRLGRMDFQLSNANGGTLTAFRVEGLSRRAVLMPPFRVGHPFDYSDYVQIYE